MLQHFIKKIIRNPVDSNEVFFNLMLLLNLSSYPFEYYTYKTIIYISVNKMYELILNLE